MPEQLSDIILITARDAWQAATLPQKKRALVGASTFLSKNYNFRGTRKTADQGLDWPRSGAFYDDGRPIENVPPEVKEATSLTAQFMLSEVPMNVNSIAHILAILEPVLDTENPYKPISFGNG